MYIHLTLFLSKYVSLEQQQQQGLPVNEQKVKEKGKRQQKVHSTPFHIRSQRSAAVNFQYKWAKIERLKGVTYTYTHTHIHMHTHTVLDTIAMHIAFAKQKNSLLSLR